MQASLGQQRLGFGAVNRNQLKAIARTLEESGVGELKVELVKNGEALRAALQDSKPLMQGGKPLEIIHPLAKDKVVFEDAEKKEFKKPLMNLILDLLGDKISTSLPITSKAAANSNNETQVIAADYLKNIVDRTA